MKKLPLFLLTLMSLFVLSCGGSDESSEEIPEIIDDYKLLSINSEGGIFEIGNNTGDTHIIGQITTVTNLIQLATICNIGTKIYSIEASYVPSPNILTIYNKLNGTTTTHQLILPPSVESAMFDPFITNLEYNGSEIIALVSESEPNNSRPNKIISINLENYQTTDLEIDFFQRTLRSTELINDNLYVSTISEGLLKINLTNKTVTELQADGNEVNGTRLAKIGNNRLALMKPIPGVVNGVKPFEFNLDTNTFSDKSMGDYFALGNTTGGTVFHNDQYLNIVFNQESKLGLLKVNYENNATEFIELDYDILDGNAMIVDVIE